MSNVRETMNMIYDINPDVYEKIMDKNLNDEELNDIAKKLSKPIKSIACKLCSVNETEQGGCKEDFIRQYNTLLMEDTEETVGRISVNNTWVNFDISIVRVVKSLLIVGVNPNEEISIKCREIINKILILGSNSSYVTQSDVIKRLNLEKGKFTGIEKELLSAIKEVLK